MENIFIQHSWNDSAVTLSYIYYGMEQFPGDLALVNNFYSVAMAGISRRQQQQRLCISLSRVSHSSTRR